MNAFKNYLNQYTSVAPLNVFRIFFGAVMTISLIRFIEKDWVNSLYLSPNFFFSYRGWEWIKPMSPMLTYGLFFTAIFSALGIMLGWKYRLNAVLFFFSFLYIELMDKTTYLNHYYLVSLVAFMMIWLPANVGFSIDARSNSRLQASNIPRWSIVSLQWMIGIVYFFAGVAKINTDWLLEAQPLKIWLATRYDYPLIGHLLNQSFTAYMMSWAGAIFDLSAPFLLLWKRTNVIMYVVVVLFHIMTKILFPGIGMFPIMMTGFAFIFMKEQWHLLIIAFIKKTMPLKTLTAQKEQYLVPIWQKSSPYVLGVFLILQTLLPFRHFMWPGEVFWTEQGFRFSWRVMVMEKMGYATFEVRDAVNNSVDFVNNKHHLTAFQEKQMAFQPDMILEYSHYLARFYKEERGYKNPSVFVESYVALNGRLSRPFVKATVDLSSVSHKDNYYWIHDFNEKINGF